MHGDCFMTDFASTIVVPVSNKHAIKTIFFISTLRFEL